MLIQNVQLIFGKYHLFYRFQRHFLMARQKKIFKTLRLLLVHATDC